MNTAEKFLTLRGASERLGIPYWKIAQAVRLGIIASYKFCNSRLYVLESEVLAAVVKSRVGGDVQ